MKTKHILIIVAVIVVAVGGYFGYDIYNMKQVEKNSTKPLLMITVETNEQK